MPQAWHHDSPLLHHPSAACDLFIHAGVHAHLRPGIMLYHFSAMEEGEVSAAAGERVQVVMDMGDWLEVITPFGEPWACG